MKYFLALCCLAVAGLSACKREYQTVAVYTPQDSSMAYLKIVHASPNFRQVFNTRDTFNVYVGAQKVNNTFLSFGSIWPFSVNATTNSITATYAGVPAGTQDIRLTVPGVVNPDSATVLTLNKNLVAGRYYTLMVTDSAKSPADSSQMFMQDNISQTLTGYYNIRFVHAVVNDTAGKNVDLVSYARNANLFSNVRPRIVSGFSLLTYNQGVIDTLYVTRPATSGTPISQRIVLAKLALNATVMGSGAYDRRSFTVYYRGDANLSTGTKARALSVYINR